MGKPKSRARRKATSETIGITHDRPLTPAQMATYLQISVAGLARRMREDKRFPHFRVGHKLRFVPSEVVQHLKGKGDAG